jgi:hypothetical protein
MLNRSHTDESLKLLNYQTPFRKDRGPNKSGGGVILYVKDNINVSRRKCVGSSIICKRLNLVKRKLILVRE